jgi:hypothetical protein
MSFIMKRLFMKKALVASFMFVCALQPMSVSGQSLVFHLTGGAKSTVTLPATFTVTPTGDKLVIESEGIVVELQKDDVMAVTYRDKKGDVNSDTQVDVADIATIISIMAGNGGEENEQNLAKGLMAYYPFNGNANDESGNGNNGTPMENVTLTTGVHGDANGAYQFGGTDNPGNIHVPNSESLQIGDEWSFAAYVKPLSISGMWGSGRVEEFGAFCIMGKSHDQHGVSIKYVYSQEESFSVDLSAWGWDEVFAADKDVTHLGKWTHVAITKSGNNYKVYINGVKLSEVETEHDYSRANSEDMYFGKYNDFWYPMNGMLDEIRIYNRTLSDSEVRQLAKYAECQKS